MSKESIREEGFDLCIEGNPFITRFKTLFQYIYHMILLRIEGNPFITRFKTRSSF